MALPRTSSDPETRYRVPQPGDLVADKYLVEAVVGTGGMGTVLAARHRQLGQSVAIKVLNPDECGRGEAVARFLREGRAAAALESDHVVRIYDVGTLEQGTVFMVMELLRGRDLASHLAQQGPLPVEEAVEYVLQACEAIAEAHARGIVHRDLKPSNLFLARRSDGQPLIKVLDFGISKLVLQAEAQPYAGELTETRSVVGSPAYMSPEQVRDPRKVDHRTDIWSLGVILYELLSGTPAFQGETLPALCAAIAADSPRPLRAARPDVPTELEAVVVRCLQKDPDLRPQSVGDLIEALRPFALRPTAPGGLLGGPSTEAGSAPALLDEESRVGATLPAAKLPARSESGRDHPEQVVHEVRRVFRLAPADSTLVSRHSVPPRRRRGARHGWSWLGAGVAGICVVAAGIWMMRPARVAPVSTSSQAVSSTRPARASFTLSLESFPTGAEVYEGHENLGKTPLLLTIDRRSVSEHPRRFELRYPGYQAYAVVQNDSEADVRVVASLVAEPRAEPTRARPPRPPAREPAIARGSAAMAAPSAFPEAPEIRVHR